MKYKKMINLLGLIFLTASVILLDSLTINCTLDTDDQNIIDAQFIEIPNSSFETQVISGFKIKILHAYYYDLDNDRNYDDIYTVISVSSISGYPEVLNAYIYHYLTLPSGRTYYIRFYAQGYQSYFKLSTKWFNVATERGWYNFKATIENYNYYGYTYAIASVMFDPPTPAPEGAMPTATYIVS
ncbi:MAG: hypothetical protein JXA54_15390 [Candidatus Heimdallarchaeota archaeon]|nr:hypothetical protein [Candidatus Heimdallarchaeota archaeon]